MKITNTTSPPKVLKLLIAGGKYLQPGKELEVENRLIEAYHDEIQPLLNTGDITVSDFGNRLRYVTNSPNDDAGGGIRYEIRNFTPPSIKFDTAVTYNEYTQTGALSLIFDNTNATNGSNQIFKIVGTGEDITFSSDFVSLKDSESDVSTINITGPFTIDMIYNDAIGKVLVGVPQVDSSIGGSPIVPEQFMFMGGVPADTTKDLYEDTSTTRQLVGQYERKIMSIVAIYEGVIDTGTISIEPLIGGVVTGSSSLDLTLSPGISVNRVGIEISESDLTAEIGENVGIRITTSNDFTFTPLAGNDFPNMRVDLYMAQTSLDLNGSFDFDIANYPDKGSSESLDTLVIGDSSDGFSLKKIAVEEVLSSSVLLIGRPGGQNITGQVSIGASSLDPSAAFQIDSTSQGMAIPSMLDSEKEAISSPKSNLLVSTTDKEQITVYNLTQQKWGILENKYQSEISTTDATPTIAATISIPTDTVATLNVQFIGRRTGGSAGTGGSDGPIGGANASTEIFLVKNVGGILSIVDDTVVEFFKENNYTYSGVVSGTDIQLRVSGKLNHNVNFKVIYSVRYV